MRALLLQVRACGVMLIVRAESNSLAGIDSRDRVWYVTSFGPKRECSTKAGRSAAYEFAGSAVFRCNRAWVWLRWLAPSAVNRSAGRILFLEFRGRRKQCRIKITKVYPSDLEIDSPKNWSRHLRNECAPKARKLQIFSSATKSRIAI